MIPGFDLQNDFCRSLFDGKTLRIKKSTVGKETLGTDPDQLYLNNSYGFRGKDFLDSDTLLTAGCSFTHGVGVPVEGTWWSTVAKKLNLSTSAAIARPGASIPWIVEKLFAYFAEFGHPKYLLCLFPDFERYIVPLDGEILESDLSAENAYDEFGTFGTSGQRFYNTRAKSRSELLKIKYLKRPYNVRNVYTTEMAVYTAIRYIRLLEQYCAATNIKLIWSTWHSPSGIYLDNIERLEELKFKNYFTLGIHSYKKNLPSEPKDFIYTSAGLDSDSDYYNCLKLHSNIDCSCSPLPESCHEDLIEIYGKENYNTGTDTGRGVDHSHPGVHLQAHYADRFIEQLMLECPYEFK